ncbi:hypothetical protein BDV95DRAFT_568054 [Massariosphaeria phaeospora]|uniref:Uncharacterized protein n=1 Tax=Massariosphaeria phaeospora TaxID=100035 RepID=A0A7C8I9Q9_9PLEO|nr:hypothetical protein BDV95DRAFT_568054 [Massariosphaeria phaeospora]
MEQNNNTFAALVTPTKQKYSSNSSFLSLNIVPSRQGAACSHNKSSVKRHNPKLSSVDQTLLEIKSLKAADQNYEDTDPDSENEPAALARPREHRSSTADPTTTPPRPTAKAVTTAPWVTKKLFEEKKKIKRLRLRIHNAWTVRTLCRACAKFTRLRGYLQLLVKAHNEVYEHSLKRRLVERKKKKNKKQNSKRN